VQASGGKGEPTWRFTEKQMVEVHAGELVGKGRGMNASPPKVHPRSLGGGRLNPPAPESRCCPYK